jgi:hypothetical protein
MVKFRMGDTAFKVLLQENRNQVNGVLGGLAGSGSRVNESIRN